MWEITEEGFLMTFCYKIKLCRGKRGMYAFSHSLKCRRQLMRLYEMNVSYVETVWTKFHVIYV